MMKAARCPSAPLCDRKHKHSLYSFCQIFTWKHRDAGMNCCCPHLPTPEMSTSFSSCIARAVLVMSMEDMDRSSLSAKSAGSGFITATSESEKPGKAMTPADKNMNTVTCQGDLYVVYHPPLKPLHICTDQGPWLSGWVEVEENPGGWPAPGLTHLHFGLKVPSKAPGKQTENSSVTASNTWISCNSTLSQSVAKLALNIR